MGTIQMMIILYLTFSFLTRTYSTSSSNLGAEKFVKTLTLRIFVECHHEQTIILKPSHIHIIMML